MTITVPTIRLPDEANPRLQPHVLVVTGETEEDRDFEIEHPEACPRLCRWWPNARADFEEGKRLGEIHGVSFGRADVEEFDCYVAWETLNAGLDSLSGEAAGVDVDGWKTTWKALPAGRYVIHGWYTPFYWAGSEPVEADGGIELVGVEGA